jgi:threonylcarbamoyladenosine tRNA methylthiotransferase MtaB
VRVHFTNLGCKLNQAELEHQARAFRAAGHAVVGRLEDAELHVVNTCTVTHQAARTSRKTARKGRRVSPRLKTVLTGCWATEEPATAAALDGVDLVVTNDHKDRLLALVEERFGPVAPAPAPDGAEELPVPYVPLAFGNTRALVKVEDGCNVGCAFCIIPSTRGRQHSRPVPDVVAEVDALARAGAREVVVTGVQISHYRRRGAGLVELTRALLDRTPVARLRLTSIAPWRFDEELFELLASPRLCRHVHLSLQSGSTATLRRMRRPYDAGTYRSVVERLRREVPGVAVTTDVIAGFPGETEEEFEESLAFARAMAFAKIHAFPYSVRQGTPAADLPGRVPHEVKKERMARLLALTADLEADFRRRHVGEELEVLWEEPVDAGTYRGTSDNYLRVETASDEDLTGRLGRVRVVGEEGEMLLGEVVTADVGRVGEGLERAASVTAGPVLLPVVG